MIELAKHIEVLLLENDCVIVPGLGGFIAHNRQAEFKESENIFCSPARTIGFNPQLVMNDGLLVQTYMQAYNTDFPDATRKIEKIVSQIKEQLYKKGEVCLPNVGTLYYTMEGTYVFEPSADSFFTPYLYGLNNVSLPKLKSLTATEEKVTIHPFIQARANAPEEEVAAAMSQNRSYKRTFQRMAQHTVGIAAAILLFFLLSVPVENTYMDDASYASLSAESMFDAIRGRSAATQLLGDTDKEDTKKKSNLTKNNVNTLKPVCVKNETVAAEPAVAKATPATHVSPKAKSTSQTLAKNINASKKAPKAEVKKAKETKAFTNKFHIIVASLATKADAQKQLKNFKHQGYSEANILEHNGRHRIALYSFNKSGEAYQKLRELRKQEDFKQAWVFNAK